MPSIAWVNKISILNRKKTTFIFVTVLNRWICATEFGQRNILLADDTMLAACSTKYVRHIIHFSPPKDKQTFLKRYQSCLTTYELKSNRTINGLKPDTENPRSIVYFDEEPCSDLVDILSLLANRAKCTLSVFLNDTMKVIHNRTVIVNRIKT